MIIRRFANNKYKKQENSFEDYLVKIIKGGVPILFGCFTIFMLNRWWT
jgi:hypothetical protein